LQGLDPTELVSQNVDNINTKTRA